ncbi:TRAP transporter large permease [Chloroflexota bacterium]
MSLAALVGLVVGLLLVLLASGLYIGVGLATIGIILFEFFADMGATAGHVMFNSLYSFALAAIPMFLLMGQIVLHSGLSGRLYRGVSKWTSVLPGGLLHSNIVSCAIFAAVSGSSPATAATIGTVAMPEQLSRGYDKAIVTASLAAGGTLGILIPPSINMIVFGAFVGESVGRLFIGGIVPGIILASMFSAYIIVAVLRNGRLAPSVARVTKRFFWEAFVAWKDVWPMAAIIVVIMGSIYAGLMTPTEAAAVSVFVALVMALGFKRLSLRVVRAATKGTMATCGMVFLVFIGANFLGNGLSMLRIPRLLFESVSNLGLSAIQLWIVVVVVYIVLGCLMDTLAMMLITLPVTYPLLVTFAGFDSVWFGVQLVLLCEMGMITPPVGINLFVIHGIAPDVNMQTIMRGIVPFFVCMVLALALFTAFPELILYLPNHMIGG